MTEAVHHIVPLHVAPDEAYTASNLAPLCRRCHDEIESRNRIGIETQSLFVGKTCADL